MVKDLKRESCISAVESSSKVLDCGSISCFCCKKNASIILTDMLILLPSV